MNKVGVEMDISNAYNFDTNDNNKILRKIVLDKINKKVQLEDKIQLDKENEVYSMFNISKDTKILVQDDKKTAKLKRDVLQVDGTYKEESLKLTIKSPNYEWMVMGKMPLEKDLMDINQNSDLKYNMKMANEEKLCIKIENTKNIKIDIEIE